MSRQQIKAKNLPVAKRTSRIMEIADGREVRRLHIVTMNMPAQNNISGWFFKCRADVSSAFVFGNRQLTGAGLIFRQSASVKKGSILLKIRLKAIEGICQTFTQVL